MAASSEPSEGIERIAKALIGEPRGASEKKAIYEEAGRAIVALSNAEEYLALAFIVLSVPVDINEAKELFISQQSFERKLKLVNFLVLHNEHRLDLWKSLYIELNSHRGFRNILAHNRLLVQQQEGLPIVTVSLEPLFYKKRGKSVRLKEIKNAADKLETTNAKLWSFIVTLNERTQMYKIKREAAS